MAACCGQWQTFAVCWGLEMKKRPNTKSELSAAGQAVRILPARAIQFSTDNPRHLRVLSALQKRPIRREDLDSIGGCSNGPELVAELRRRGLELPCTRVEVIDRDGQKTRPGVYNLTDKDRKKLNRWLFLRGKK